jgi:hypothetical protein
MSLVLFGPLSFLSSIAAIGFFRASTATKTVLLLLLWPILFLSVFAGIQPRLIANAAVAGTESKDAWRTLAFLYQLVIPLLEVVALLLLRRSQRKKENLRE